MKCFGEMYLICKCYAMENNEEKLYFFVHFVVSKVGIVVVEDTGNLLLTVTGISQVQHCPDRTILK